MRLFMPVLRTLVFVFVVGFTARALPFYWGMPGVYDEQIRRYKSAQEILRNGVLLALAWILLEVILGWLAVRRGKEAPPPAGPVEPPRP